MEYQHPNLMHGKIIEPTSVSWYLVSINFHRCLPQCWCYNGQIFTTVFSQLFPDLWKLWNRWSQFSSVSQNLASFSVFRMSFLFCFVFPPCLSLRISSFHYIQDDADTLRLPTRGRQQVGIAPPSLTFLCWLTLI